LRSCTGGDIQGGDGGQRGLSVSTNCWWRWSNGTWTTGTGRSARYGTWDSIWKNGPDVRCTEPHVPLSDARAWVPGELSLHQSARTKPLTAALSQVANMILRHSTGQSCH
ncbi:hypothetical protein GOODEAATRI_003206, partial [Goodea atripinnis]